jgi:hypothetical protein
MAAIDKLYVHTFQEYKELKLWALIYYPKLLLYFYNISLTYNECDENRREWVINTKEVHERDFKKLGDFKTIEEAITNLQEYYKKSANYKCPFSQADDEVEYIMTRLKHLQEEYFLDLPLASSLKHAKKFLYNIPKNVFNLIKKVDEEQPDSLLSPLFMIYPLLTTGIGIETQRVYLERISYSIKDEGDDDGDE